MINPVFRRELRTNLRSWRSFAVVSLYVFLLCLFAGLTLLAIYGGAYNYGFNPREAIKMYAVLSGFQVGFIMIIIPSITCSTISGERERQTLDLILVTKMSTFSIIFGKILSSGSMVVLLILSSLPVYGVVMYYGGVNILQLLGMFGFSLATAIMVGCLSIWYSSVFKKTIASLSMTFITLGFLGIGFYIILQLVNTILVNFNGEGFSIWIWYIIFITNPLFGFVSLIDYQLGSSFINDMLYSLSWSHSTSNNVEYIFPVWISNLIFNIVISLILILFSAKIINPVRKKWKKVKPVKEDSYATAE